ncbi:MAG: hypothetical protein A2086_16335 [Spirochaetes bacterium GWD1_27_9]|nr:MAG: hypothetical protein A2086_16335 [Spirochaetes bacterium GWD1_27_9]
MNTKLLNFLSLFTVLFISCVVVQESDSIELTLIYSDGSTKKVIKTKEELEKSKNISFGPDEKLVNIKGLETISSKFGIIANKTGIKLNNFNKILNLTYLRLNNCNIEEINEIDMPNIEYLDLSNDSIKKINGPLNMPKLKELILSNNELTDIKCNSQDVI